MIFWNGIWRLTADEYDQLPDGCHLLENYSRKKHIIDKGRIMYWTTTFNSVKMSDYGVIDPNAHPEAELFTVFTLS